MKRNLIGFALFATILVVTTIVYQTFLATQITEISAVQISQDFLKYPPVRGEKIESTCRIRQATLDLHTERLNVELQSCNQSEFATTGQSFITLHAFIKDAGYARRVASKTSVAPSNFDKKNNRIVTTVRISADWLIESKQKAANLKDNLYLIAQTSGASAEMSTTSFGFDERQAVPVLLVVGE